MHHLFLPLLFFLPLSAAAQTATATATLSGEVRDESGASLPAAEITITASVDGIVTTTQSDTAGRFELSGLAPGRYTVIAERQGFVPAVIADLVLNPGASRSVILELRVPSVSEVVSVGAERGPPDAAPSTIAVAPQAVQSVAGAGENIYRVLQTLPGVTAVNDFDSRLSVRGGGPDQNLTVMDGVEIHNPYRLFGLTSAFNPETVESFELITGGFSAKYGDRLSSILVVENRPGSAATGFGATAALGLTDANVIGEGRLPGMNGSSWLVTGRRTYYDLIAERIVDADLPSFADLQARADVQMRPGHKLTVFGLNSRENTDARFDDLDDGNGDGEGAGDEFVDILTSTLNDLGAVSYSAAIGTRAYSRTTASWYRNRELIDFNGGFRTGSRRSNRSDSGAEPLASIIFTRNLSIRDLALRQELTVNAGASHLIEAGFESHTLDTTWRWRISGDRNFDAANGSSGQGGSGIPSLLDSRQASHRAGVWLTDRWTIGDRLRVEPGVRVDWSGITREAIASPRIALVADVADQTRARLAGGLFTQSPGYEKLLQSDYFLDLSDAGDLSLSSERAWHALASVERRMPAGLALRVEGYYKDFDRLVLGRLETSDEVAARVATYAFPDELSSGIPRAPQVTSIPANLGSGRAYGVELYAAKAATSASSRLTGWASYTWGRAETTAYGRTFAADYDRRHALSVVGSYRLSRLIEVAATIRAQSGFPYTPAIGLRPATLEDPATAGTDVTRIVPLFDDQGLLVWSADYGDSSNFNTGRLPVFARVDARVTFRPRWSNDRWQLYVEVINVLNRDNASDLSTELVYDPDSDRPRLTEVRSGRLPLLPTLGIRYRF
jgi:outer membrane receptor for ferrienterochelin and colicin